MQSQQHVQREFIARAKMLAHVMTSSTNIEVTISGTTASCSFGHINLPAGDYTDPVFKKMVQGWIDHELGHEDETSPVYTRLSQDNKVLAKIFNIVEDVRMEKSRGVKFRGAKTNLSTLAELAIEREYFAAPSAENIGALIFGLILYRGRAYVIGQHCLDDYAEQALQLLNSQINSSFANGLCQLIDKITFLKDSKGSLDLSLEIVDYINQEGDQQQDDPSNDDQKSQQGSEHNGEDQESTDTQNSPSEPDDSVEQEQADTGDSTPNDSDNESDDHGNATSQSSEDEQETDNEQSDSQPASSAQSSQCQLFDKMEECQLQDYHDVIAEMLQVDAISQPKTSRVSPECSFVENAELYNHDASYIDIPLARRLSANVYQALHKVLFDIQPELPVNRKRGKRINHRCFSGIPAGNTKIFHSRVEQEVKQAVISLVIDASPSMSADDRMTAANNCALAFAFALDRLNIPFEVVYYGSYDSSKAHYTMYRPKTFDTRFKPDNFAIQEGNYGTPTGEAMQFALYPLALRSESNKLMLLLTDGESNDASRVQKSNEIATAFGIKVVPFGICTDSVDGFNDNEFVSLSQLSAITPALRQATKQKLFS